MPSEVDALNLTRRYEDQRLLSASTQDQAVPTLLITGFLGSGKTTLVQHILRNRCGLKIAVLVNELGDVDLDSQFVNLKQGNAALGITEGGSDLSGGCLCCHGHDALREALHRIRTQARPDYLVLETSGAADAEPLVGLLQDSGFRLDAVATVIDAEAGAQALQQHGVALRQVRSADVVILNKCDLADLAGLAGLEDLLQELAPGVRCMRARWGMVPIPALLDVEPLGTTATGPSSPTSATSAPALMAFMSHESVPAPAPAFRVAGQPGQKMLAGRGASSLLQAGPGGRAGPGALRRQKEADAHHSTSDHASDTAHAAHHHHDHHHHLADDHADLHGGFHTVTVTASHPLGMAAFQDFVLHHLMRAPGLYRCKGIVWFNEHRSHRFLFNLSGRQRVECRQEAAWDGPPGVVLVLIGRNLDQLTQLQDMFQSQVVAAAGQGGALEQAAVARQLAVLVSGHERLQVLPADRRTSGTEAASAGQEASARPAATLTASAATAAATAGSSSLVAFSARSAPRHGVQGEEVNAALMQRVNAAGSVMLYAVSGAGTIDSTSLVQRADRIVALQYAVPVSGAAASAGDPAQPGCSSSGGGSQPGVGHSDARDVDAAVEADKMLSSLDTAGGAAPAAHAAAASLWHSLQTVMDPVLRKAYQHVHACNCDFVTST